MQLGADCVKGKNLTGTGWFMRGKVALRNGVGVVPETSGIEGYIGAVAEAGSRRITHLHRLSE